MIRAQMPYVFLPTLLLMELSCVQAAPAKVFLAGCHGAKGEGQELLPG